MESSQFDRITTRCAQTRSRRTVLRHFGAAALGAVGMRLFFPADSEASRRRKDKRNEPDVAIGSIKVETTAEAAHDDVVVQFINKGTRTANEFRIGLSAVRSDGTARNEVFSLPQRLAPGDFGVVTFRLGCSWLNGGTVTARTDPSPIPGESAGNKANNVRSVTFASSVCS